MPTCVPRIDCTANSAVSLVIPTLTKPALAVTSKGAPRRVNVHDFEDKKLGKVVPYGVYS